MKRKEILEKAIQTVCSDRQDRYGEAENSFGLIADLWSGLIGIKVTSKDVVLMMILLKMARIKTGKPHDDNWIDIAGYAACGGELNEKEISGN